MTQVVEPLTRSEVLAPQQVITRGANRLWVAIISVVLLAVALVVGLLYNGEQAAVSSTDIEAIRAQHHAEQQAAIHRATTEATTKTSVPASEPRSEEAILRDLANRGLIPEEAVSQSMNKPQQAALQGAVNRGLVTKGSIDRRLMRRYRFPTDEIDEGFGRLLSHPNPSFFR